MSHALSDILNAQVIFLVVNDIVNGKKNFRNFSAILNLAKENDVAKSRFQENSFS